MDSWAKSFDMDSLYQQLFGEAVGRSVPPVRFSLRCNLHDRVIYFDERLLIIRATLANLYFSCVIGQCTRREETCTACI
jgi:hypothetical protein